MSRFYAINLGGQFIGSTIDIFGIYAGSLPFKLREFFIISDNGTGSTDDNLAVVINRLAPTVTHGSGGAVATPVALTSTEQAASFSARQIDSTQATSSVSNVTLISGGLNTLAGWHFAPPAEMCPVFQPGEACTIASGGGAPSGVDYTAYAIIEEIT